MARRELAFSTIDEMIADVESLLARGYRREGNWTLAQVCDHLAIFFRGPVEGYPSGKIPWYVRLLAPLILRRILKTGKLAEGVRVPESLLPGEPGDDAEAVRNLIEAAKRYRDHQGKLHANPVFGNLDRATSDRLQLIHAAHHLSFLIPEEGDAA
ncbi:MAG: DUF1569 domain-containing protein [Planctomycetota bacterium]|nr:MAG: DUF1569 domain-containing protein [Planctomycetota bacterium]